MKRAFHTVLMVLALWAHGAFAAPATTDASYQEAVRSQVAPLVKGALSDFFNRAGLTQPTHVDVDMTAQVDAGEGQARVSRLDVQVSFVTDHPPEIVRAARAAVQRALQSNGYRFDQNATGEDALRPLAQLTVDVTQQETPAGTNGLRQYLTLGALVLGAVAAFILLLVLLVRPFTRRRRVLPPTQLHPGGADLEGIWGAMNVDAPPPPPSEPEVGLSFHADAPPPPPAAVHVAAPADALAKGSLPPVTIPDFKALARASSATVRQAFDQLPFEKALDLLADADTETRALIIEKLQLKAPVRERLERELDPKLV